MGFYKTYLKYKNFDFDNFLASISTNKIYNILQKQRLDELDFLSLLSETASTFLEDMAQKSHSLTIQHFGKIIFLFTPIYISNLCTNQCIYCGFSAKNKFLRKHLSLAEIEIEAKKIAQTGLKHILLLTGDTPKIASINYIKDAIRTLKKYFTSIGIEIYALTEDEYKELIRQGVDSLTIYQETYNEELYLKLHIKGPKKDYLFRMDAPERACKAKMRTVNVGALLGLTDWKKDAFFAGLHANYLQNKYLDTEISISMPRIRPHTGDFIVKYPVSDKAFVQIMTAFRIFMPRVGITISTREAANFRNNIIRLGVTRMSAGSSTAVGGRTQKDVKANQFDIADERSVKSIKKAISRLGYQPIFKDWQDI